VRLIKFRAWDDVNKLMLDSECDGLFIHFDGELNSMDENGDISGTANTRQLQIMQYTGLTDKHGQEIYEGDVVRLQTYGESGDALESDDCVTAKVQYRKNHFSLLDKDGDHWTEWFTHYLEDVEVIGNIHENPDLLKEA
jgi:uncharacterized phage protein (TIGR01671 family)